MICKKNGDIQDTSIDPQMKFDMGGNSFKRSKTHLVVCAKVAAENIVRLQKGLRCCQ